MGEVYRARDTKLGRDVARQVLAGAHSRATPSGSRASSAKRACSRRSIIRTSARSTASRSRTACRRFVLELVEGQTLADRVAPGPLSARAKRLAIARQIADALEAAHERGIVHRDLKPANIKITPDGVVKVLDFGLAKAFAGESPAPDLTQSPTLTVGGTRDGVILGTAAYMSPEQARGQAVDKRTDIWAFGCVLYEMLTGQRPSRARPSRTPSRRCWSASRTGALPAETPAGIRRLLHVASRRTPSGACATSATRASKSRTTSRPARALPCHPCASPCDAGSRPAPRLLPSRIWLLLS